MTELGRYTSNDALIAVFTELLATMEELRILTGYKVGTNLPQEVTVNPDGSLRVQLALDPTLSSHISNLFIHHDTRQPYSSIAVSELHITDDVRLDNIFTGNRLANLFSFLVKVEGIDPTASNHLSTKNYVDTAISTATSGNVYNENPAGAIGGGNQVFTTAFNFVAGTTQLYKNGLRQELGSAYTETGANQITYNVAPGPTATHKIDYVKS